MAVFTSNTAAAGYNNRHKTSTFQTDIFCYHITEPAKGLVKKRLLQEHTPGPWTAQAHGTV